MKKKIGQVTVVPAQAGWSVVEPEHGDEDRVVGVHREPVVAWIVDLEKDEDDRYSDWRCYSAVPVCAIALSSISIDDPVLQRPDGSVTCAGEDIEPEKVVEWMEDRRRRRGGS